ncbi:hypothetical protein ACOMHN_019079 [Nucella lapillus]
MVSPPDTQQNRRGGGVFRYHRESHCDGLASRHAAESERGGVFRYHRESHCDGLASRHAVESGWRGFQVSLNHWTASSLVTHGADSTDSS